MLSGSNENEASHFKTQFNNITLIKDSVTLFS